MIVANRVAAINGEGASLAMARLARKGAGGVVFVYFGPTSGREQEFRTS